MFAKHGENKLPEINPTEAAFYNEEMEECTWRYTE